MHSLFDSKHSKAHHDLQDLRHKVFNVCVVGLSGTERDKGPLGIGKSCLCNRFIRSAVDDYSTNHISVLSQSDFGGRVVNNDQWLYWGSIIKTCDGVDLAFNVIEQTEFVDDSSFQPFKIGKIEPYYKRCASTKLISPEKLMYICKNQLGVEREYEQRYLPDGKFNVDGFLCLFDVSDVQGRNIDKQVEMTNLILMNLVKTKKPVVFVTTKNDEANELFIAKAMGLVNQREFRGMIPLIETSADENVNINTAFLTCAQLINRIKSKLRIMPYLEARKNHRELLRAANDAYVGLIRSTVIDWTDSWQQVCKNISHNPEFLRYTYLHGLDKAHQVYKNHVTILKNECIDQKVQIFMKLLPDILTDMIGPDQISNNNDIQINLNDMTECNWESIKTRLRSHPQFDSYFIQPESNWYEADILYSIDARIPFDWLNSSEAFNVFKSWTLKYGNEQRRLFAKELFSQTLEDSCIPVGKPFVELKYLFSDNTNFEILSDQDLFEIYVDYQNKLLERARHEFNELLMENTEHLQRFSSPDIIITQEDIKTINSILSHDDRYQALNRFDKDRTLIIIRHLSFLQSQTSQQCPSFQNPKPGKLDLKQFDNVTDAIKKLNIQPTSKILDTQEQLRKTLISKDESQNLDKIKSKLKKSKFKTKDSSLKEAKSFDIESQAVIKKDFLKEVDKDTDEKNDQIVKLARTIVSHNRFVSNHSSTSDSFESQSDLSSPKNQPKPEPRLATISPKQIGGFSGQGNKRTTGVRHNHGIAVAPPQLPPDSYSSNPKEDTSKNLAKNHDAPFNVTSRNLPFKANNSPISQRLVKNSAEHRVSALNSPLKSDTNSIKLSDSRKYGSKGFNEIKSSQIDDQNDIMLLRANIKEELNELLANKKPVHRQDFEKPLPRSTSELTSDCLNAKSDKKAKKQSKDDEKLEKRRLKDVEKQKRLEKKLVGKKSKSTCKADSIGDDGIPLFVKRCIEFIELEGLDAEGIYRVPGNRAHVDAFVSKFEENPNMSMLESDIPVNAVATALKDFLSKKTGPIIPLDMMNGLTQISTISDEEERISSIRSLIHRLPEQNFRLLRFVFGHFSKISKNCAVNSMDSKNLAICWWPTILPIHFTDMVMFEQVRPHLELSTQTMIDKFELIFETYKYGERSEV